VLYYSTIYTQHLFYFSIENYLSAINPVAMPEKPLYLIRVFYFKAEAHIRSPKWIAK